MTQHTQEPWHIFEGTVQSDTNWTICDARTKLKNADANARRIVACVNACAGIPTERLESCRVVLMSVDAEKLTEIAKQRDALQDKIDDLLDSVEYMRDTFNRSAQHALDEARKIGG